MHNGNTVNGVFKCWEKVILDISYTYEIKIFFNFCKELLWNFWCQEKDKYCWSASVSLLSILSIFNQSTWLGFLQVEWNILQITITSRIFLKTAWMISLGEKTDLDSKMGQEINKINCHNFFYFFFHLFF